VIRDQDVPDHRSLIPGTWPRGWCPARRGLAGGAARPIRIR